MKNVYHNFKDIEAVVLDVDGVLTKGEVLVTEEGDELRTMNIKDGYAIKQCTNLGVKIFIISGGYSRGVYSRLKRLGVSDIFMRVEDKLDILKKIAEENGLSFEKMACMGDDIPDLPMMRALALSSCPSDARPEVIEIADFVSRYNGGLGCVRDLLEKILKAKNLWKV